MLLPPLRVTCTSILALALPRLSIQMQSRCMPIQVGAVEKEIEPRLGKVLAQSKESTGGLQFMDRIFNA